MVEVVRGGGSAGVDAAAGGCGCRASSSAGALVVPLVLVFGDEVVEGHVEGVGHPLSLSLFSRGGAAAAGREKGGGDETRGTPQLVGQAKQSSPVQWATAAVGLGWAGLGWAGLLL